MLRFVTQLGNADHRKAMDWTLQSVTPVLALQKKNPDFVDSANPLEKVLFSNKT